MYIKFRFVFWFSASVASSFTSQDRRGWWKSRATELIPLFLGWNGNRLQLSTRVPLLNGNFSKQEKTSQATERYSRLLTIIWPNGLNVCHQNVRGSNPKSASHFGGRRQLSVAQIFIIPDVMQPCVIQCRSEFKTHGCRFYLPPCSGPYQSWRMTLPIHSRLQYTIENKCGKLFWLCLLPWKEKKQGVVNDRLQNSKLLNSTDKIFGIQEWHRLWHRILSPIVSNHRFNGFLTLLLGRLTATTRTSPPASFRNFLPCHRLTTSNYHSTTTSLEQQSTTRYEFCQRSQKMSVSLQSIHIRCLFHILSPMTQYLMPKSWVTHKIIPPYAANAKKTLVFTYRVVVHLLLLTTTFRSRKVAPISVFYYYTPNAWVQWKKHVQ